MHKDKWNRRYSEKGLSGPGQPSPVLVEVATELSPGRALDLAAGQGRNAFYLAEQGWDTTAVDFSEVAIEKGRMLSRGLELPIHWELRDLADYTPPQAHYDFVCLFYLHMPWEEYAEILRRAAAAVTPGGTLLVVGHDRSNIEHGSGGPQDPAVLYTPADIAAVLKHLSGSSEAAAASADGKSAAAAPAEPSSAPRVSFEIIRAETRTNPVDHGHAGAGGEQIDCIVAARRPGS
jgi:SAM-dependent methyltransferase